MSHTEYKINNMRGWVSAVLAFGCVSFLTRCFTTHIRADIMIPPAVTVIEEEAFYGDSSIGMVILPDGIMKIESRAFAETGILSATIPGSVIFIADDAFDPGVLIEAAEESYAFAWAEENGFIIKKAMTAGKKETVEICAPGDIRAFTFTPAAAGYYTFSTSGDEELPPVRAVLYDDRMVDYCENDPTEGKKSLRLCCWLDAGIKYTLIVRLDGETTGSFELDVRETEGLILVEPVGSLEVEAHSGDQIPLEVRAESTGDIYYEWYYIGWFGRDENGMNYWYRTQLQDQNGNQCVAGPVSKDGRYECVVSDEYGYSETVCFRIVLATSQTT